MATDWSQFRPAPVDWSAFKPVAPPVGAPDAPAPAGAIPVPVPLSYSATRLAREAVGATGQPYGAGVGYLLDNPLTRAAGQGGAATVAGIDELAGRGIGLVSPEAAAWWNAHLTQPAVATMQQLAPAKDVGLMGAAVALPARLAGQLATGFALGGGAGAPETAVAAVPQTLGAMARAAAPAARSAAVLGSEQAASEAAQMEAAGRPVSGAQLAAMAAADTAAFALPMSKAGAGLLTRAGVGAASGTAGQALMDAANGHASPLSSYVVNAGLSAAMGGLHVQPKAPAAHADPLADGAAMADTIAADAGLHDAPEPTGDLDALLAGDGPAPSPTALTPDELAPPVSVDSSRLQRPVPGTKAPAEGSATVSAEQLHPALQRLREMANGDQNAQGLRTMAKAGEPEPTPEPTAKAEALAVHATEHPVVRLPVADLTLSTDVPQFKTGAKAETGVVEPLAGRYDERGTGPIQVWRRTDGRLEVISGRHRLDLARRTGKDTLPVQVYDEADGFTPQMAAALDAELNIHDGQGSTADYVQHFQSSGISKDAAEQLGLLARSKGQRAFALSQSGSPGLIAAHRAGEVGDEAAVQIAQAAPGDARLQALGMAQVKDGRTIVQAVNTMRALSTMGGSKVEQGDIFGFNDSALRDAEAMSRAATARQRAIGERLAAISGAAKRPELAKAEGIDVHDPEAIKSRIADLRAERDAWANWATDPAKVAAVRKDAGIAAATPPEPAPEAPADPAPTDDVTAPMFSRARGDEATADIFGAPAKAKAPERAKPAQNADLFGGPKTADLVDAAARAKDAKRNGLAGGREESGDGGLFDGERPEQVRMPPPVQYDADVATDKPVVGKQEQRAAGDESRRDADHHMSHRPAGPEFGSRLDDLEPAFSDDIYRADAADLHGHGIRADRQAIATIRNARGKPNKFVTIYRAVPKDASDAINAGDWVTLTRDYARDHGDSVLDGDYKIVTAKVPVRSLFNEGNSIHEFGYQPNDTSAPVDSGADGVLRSERKPTPIIGDDTVTAGLTGIGQHDDAFQLQTSDADTLPGVFRDIEPGYTAAHSADLAEGNVEPADKAWNITTPEGESAKVFQKGDTVWIDVSDLDRGQSGKRIYNAVANYARNTHRVFIGDPAGLSDIGLKRRAENMLSSAVKFGSTDHLQPHDRQLQGDKALGVPAMKWRHGETAHNLRELARVTQATTEHEFPEIAGMRYSTERLRFERPDGTEVTDADFENLAAGKRRAARAYADDLAGRQPKSAFRPHVRALRASPTAGRRSLKRAILVKQLASGEGQALAQLLAGHGGRGAEHSAGESLPGLRGVLYSAADEAPADAGVSISEARDHAKAAWGNRLITRLEQRGDLEFATAADLARRGIDGIRSGDDLAGVKGLYDPRANDGRGKAYIVADHVRPDEMAGVVLHEVGVHHGLRTIVGADTFKGIVSRLRRLRDAGDADVKRAYEAVPEDTAPHRRDEEALAYLAEQTPGHGLIRRLVDAVKRGLNRLGIPLSKLESEPEAIRRMMRENLRQMGKGEGVTATVKSKAGVLYQKVFHGTPHTVDRFSLQHIGTGEGAQAYGWGMYFAGRKEIAQHYRDQLTASYAFLDGEPLRGGIIDRSSSPERRAEILLAPTKSRQEAERAIATGGIGEQGASAARQMIADGRVTWPERKGNLYHVEVPEDSDLLDWDKPLSEQPPKVRKNLMRVLDDLASDEGTFWERDLQAIDALSGVNKKPFTGADLYADIQEALGSRDSKAASEYLNSIGIPGLRYFDGGSRSGTGGWKVKFKNGDYSHRIFESQDAAQAAVDRGDFNSVAGVELVTAPTHNYVIWDEAAMGAPEAVDAEPLLSRRTRAEAEREAATKRATLRTALDTPTQGGTLGWDFAEHKWEGTKGKMHKARADGETVARDTNARVATDKPVAGKQKQRAAGDESRREPPDGYERLYHGGHDGLTEISGDLGPGNIFGGIFATYGHGSALSHGSGALYGMDVPADKILTQDKLDAIDESAVDRALRESMPRLANDDMDIARQAVIDDAAHRVDADDLIRVFRGDDRGESQWEAQRIRGAVARHLGFDAVEMSDEHGTSFLVLPGTKVFRINESNASVDSGAPLLSRRTRAEAERDAAIKRETLRNTLDAPTEGGTLGWDFAEHKWEGTKGKMHKARADLQDKMLAWKDAQDSIATALQTTIPDAANVYRIENLMHGRVKEGFDTLEHEQFEPLAKAMRRAKVQPAELERYLYARHAKERNADIAAKYAEHPQDELFAGVKSPADLDGFGSGMTDAEADAILANAEPKLKPLADRVDRIVRDTRRRLLRHGLITQAQFDAMEAQYQHFVPLRGKAFRENAPETLAQGTGAGRGIDTRPKVVREALGRGKGNLAENILAHVIGDAQRSIILAEKARVGRGVLRLALMYPNDALWHVEPVQTERKLDANGQVYEAVVNDWSDPSVVAVKHKGQLYKVQFENVQLAKALTNVGVDQMDAITRTAGALNRYFSSVLTRYNPAFIPVNASRDALFGLTGIAVEHGEATALRAAANYPAALKAAWREARRLEPANDADRYAKEFARAGGKTGYVHMPSVEDLGRKIGHGKLGSYDPKGIAKVGKVLGDIVGVANDSVENALRLATYMTLRKQGHSIEQAAEYAKNVTVNFNRKGYAGSRLNAWLLFYNASMQGAHRTAKLMRHPKTWAYLGSFAAAQTAATMYAMGQTDAQGEPIWNKVPDYVKQRNLVFTWLDGDGDQHLLTIPMPYGFNLFPYLAGRITQSAMNHAQGRSGRDDTPGSIAGGMLSTAVQSFSPIPLDDGALGLVPTALRIPLSIQTNRDDWGGIIRRENPYGKHDVPRSTIGRPDTLELFKLTATGLNRLGGGDDYTPPAMSAFDVAPEDIEYVLDKLGGGAGRFVIDVATLGQKAATDRQHLTASDIPITERFYSTRDEGAAERSLYYDRRDVIDRASEKIRDTFQSQGEAAALKLLRASPGMQGADFHRYKTFRNGHHPGQVILYDGRPQIVVRDADSVYGQYRAASQVLAATREAARHAYSDAPATLAPDPKRDAAIRREQQKATAALKRFNAAWNRDAVPHR